MSCNEWKLYKLKDICLKIGSGSTPRGGASVYKEEGITLIRSQNVYNNSFDYSGLVFIDDEAANKLKNVEIKENDVLLNITGDSVARCTIVPNELLPARVNQHVCILRADTKVLNPIYLKSFLVNSKMQQVMLSLAKSGGTRAALTKGMIENFEILVPPLEEQGNIDSILSSLDDKIELNNEMNKTLEEMAQSIFKRWFVDFEFPNEDGEPYKSSGGEMIDSELGMIPKGWEVKSLDEIADFLNGLAMQKFRPQEDEIDSLPVLKIKELKQGSTSVDSDRCSYNIDPKYIIDDGDVVFAWSGSLDVRIWCGGKAGLNQHLFKVTSREYNKWFYYLWVKRYLDDFIRIAADRATTMGHIKRSNLSEAKVLVPNINTLEAMDCKMKNILDVFIEKNIESKNLEVLRNVMLPKLISGEIRVK